jgi:hypothetical protein
MYLKKKQIKCFWLDKKKNIIDNQKVKQKKKTRILTHNPSFVLAKDTTKPCLFFSDPQRCDYFR